MTYSSKLQSEKYKEKDLINLAWKIKEVTELDEMGRCCYREINAIVNRIEHDDCLWEEENIPRQLKNIRQRLITFIKGITRHKRTAATHVLVFMISGEERKTKPYALPVQCIPYKGLPDIKVRELANNIIQEMVKRKMKVAGTVCIYKYIYFIWLVELKGFTTDGEWNMLRIKGNKRPLSVLQIRIDSRNKFSRMSLQKMTGMISPIRML